MTTGTRTKQVGNQTFDTETEFELVREETATATLAAVRENTALDLMSQTNVLLLELIDAVKEITSR